MVSHMAKKPAPPKPTESELELLGIEKASDEELEAIRQLIEKKT
jgi:hypothetical protein